MAAEKSTSQNAPYSMIAVSVRVNVPQKSSHTFSLELFVQLQRRKSAAGRPHGRCVARPLAVRPLCIDGLGILGLYTNKG